MRLSKKPRRVCRPQAANQVRSFSPGACTWAKILLSSQVWNLFAPGEQIMRAADCKPFVQKGLCPFWTEGLQSAARIICSLKANKFHTCRLRSVFCDVHAASLRPAARRPGPTPDRSRVRPRRSGSGRRRFWRDGCASCCGSPAQRSH